jgi:hypothetical protein
VTAQALMALERAPLPIATVPRAKRARAAGDESPAAATPAPAPPASDEEQAPAKANTSAPPADGSGERGASKRAGGPPGEAAGVLPADGTATPRADTASTATAQSAVRAAEDAGDDGVPIGLVAGALAVTIALLALFRRRLVPRRFRRSRDAVT